MYYTPGRLVATHLCETREPAKIVALVYFNVAMRVHNCCCMSTLICEG